MNTETKTITAICAGFIVLAVLLGTQAMAQDVAYCKNGTTGQVITIQAGYACPFGFYRI